MLISKRRWQERKEAISRYYKGFRFPLIDLTFGLLSLFFNPYRVCRKFLQKRGEKEVHVYGETPYTTYERIVKECGIGAQDVWVEVGAGRGKGCFWLAHFVKCRVIAIEWVPQFVRMARAIQMLFQMRHLHFALQDAQTVDLQGATFIYLYGSFPPLRIPPQAKVLTISEPLEGFTLLKSFWVRYPWGRTRAFLQIAAV